MKITYDFEEDILYIHLRKAKPEDSFDFDPGVTVDLKDRREDSRTVPLSSLVLLPY